MPDLNNWPTPRLLSTAARLVEHAWDENLAGAGLTHAGFIALEVLDAQGPMTQARLAGGIRVQAQTIGKTLARLEAHGHVTRVPGVADRRSHQVAISEPGKRALDEARQLELNMLLGGEVATKELRELLVTVVRRLGSARWD